ncbi:unnamed protein product [Ixodes pacificus]
MTCLIKTYSLLKFSASSFGCVFHGKGQVLTQGACFTEVTVNGVTFCVESHDKSRRLEAVGANGERVFGRTVLIECNKLSIFPASVKTLFFDIQELKVKSVSLVDLIHNVDVQEFVSVELTQHVVQVNSLSLKKCVALRVEENLFLCIVKQSYMFGNV